MAGKNGVVDVKSKKQVSGLYFKTEMAVLRKLARTKQSFRNLSAFLVLARHGNGNPPEGVEPFMYSGAGIRCVAKKAFMGEPSAKITIDFLTSGELIKKVPDHKISYGEKKWKRYELNHESSDLDLPHELTDGMKGKNLHHVDSPTKRIRDYDFSGFISEHNGFDENALQTDALMLLLEMYNSTEMELYGGIDPAAIHRNWYLSHTNQRKGVYTWSVYPDEKEPYWFSDNFIMKALHHAASSPLLKERFRHAFKVLLDTGLIYDVVSYLPDRSKPGKREHVTVFVNDAHASRTDTSLKAVYAERCKMKHAFNSTPESPGSQTRYDGELLFDMPMSGGSIVGIFRPRFRTSNQSCGRWNEQEKVICNNILTQLNDVQLQST